MSSRAIAVVLWAVAVTGAVALLVGPLTPWGMPVESVGLIVCLTASAALTAWFLRH